MDKSEYLKLAHEKGWDTSIPQLEDGTYDCDVFGGNGVLFNFDVHISGNLSLGAGAFTRDIFAGGIVALGEGADSCTITAGEDFICGDGSDIGEIFVLNGDAIIGENSVCRSVINVTKCAVIGKHSRASSVCAAEDILYDD